MVESDGGANGDFRRRQYNVEERISNVRERLGKLEGLIEEWDKRVATKEDVANAKLQLVLAWIAAGLAALSGIATVALLLVRIVN